MIENQPEESYHSQLSIKKNTYSYTYSSININIYFFCLSLKISIMDDMLKCMLVAAILVTIWQWSYIKTKLNSMIKSTPTISASSSATTTTGSSSTTGATGSGPASSFGTRSRYTPPSIPLSARPFDRNVVARACSNCSSGASCSCPGVGDKAHAMIQQQKNRNAMNKVGGGALKQKIRQGNRLPATVIKSHMASNSSTPGVTSDDPGDFSEYMKNNSINPDTVTSHKKYVQESKMFSQQPDKPSDAIESNYGNYWGIGRRNFKPPSDGALFQFGANDEDYDTNWSASFG